MTNYVVGFLFSVDHKRVALIRKLKPEWQKGRLNGIGGKIEPGESPIEAQVREFYEEAGPFVVDWLSYTTLRPPLGGDVRVFRAFGDFAIESKTDELVAWYPIAKLDKLPVLSNLRWLIPLALDGSTVGVTAEAA